MNRRTHFDILGVDSAANDEAIKKAYLIRSKMFHPDRFDREKQTREWELANEMLKELNESYAVLRDESRRVAYLASLQSPAARPATEVSPAAQNVVSEPPTRRGRHLFWIVALLIVLAVVLAKLNATFGLLDRLPAFPFTGSAASPPASGEVRNSTGRPAVAPFQITAPAESSFLVKLEETGTHRPAVTIFVRAGETVKVRVPVGTYEVKYASGARWEGYERLFGAGTHFSKAARVFTFQPDGSRYTGYALVLSQAAPGNLKASGLAPSDF